MDFLKELKEDYMLDELITQEEFENAEKQMPPEEFDIYYMYKGGKFYRRVAPNDNQLLYAMLDEITINLESLNRKVGLFYILAIVGIACSIIWAIISII